jgi:hypothetical protein
LCPEAESVSHDRIEGVIVETFHRFSEVGWMIFKVCILDHDEVFWVSVFQHSLESSANRRPFALVALMMERGDASMVHGKVIGYLACLVRRVIIDHDDLSGP